MNHPNFPPRTSPWWLLGLLLVLLAFNLRLIFPSVSVLLPDIREALGWSDATAGYLTTLPVLCLGVFALFAPWCARRFGLKRALLVVLIALTVGTGLRGVWGSWGLFVGTALAGAAIAVANVLLPSLVKRDFPNRVALMTGLYTMGLNVGGAVTAAFTVPLVLATSGTWKTGVAAWAVPPAVMALLWASQCGRRNNPPQPPHRPLRGIWSSPLAWQVTCFMGLQSATAYCVSGWLAPILRERGLDGTTAGWVTSVCILMNAIGSIAITPLVARWKNQQRLNLVLAALASLPLLGILFAPLSLVWVWAVVQGLAQGAMFTTALTVIVLRSADSDVAATLSSMAQTVGYVLAACGPLLIGLLYGWIGDFDATGWLFVGIGMAASLAGWGAGRTLHVDARPR